MSDWTLHSEPHRHYRYKGSWTGANKQRIASVTQVLAGPGQLTDWAERQALVAAEWVVNNWLNGAPVMARSLLSFGELAQLSGVLPSQVRDGKGASGTAVHNYFYEMLTQDASDSPAPYGLRCAVDNFIFDHAPVADAAEVAVGSHELAVAGTYDAVVYMDGAMHRLDLKQSGGVYPSMFAQLAAYENLDTDNYCDYLTIVHIDDCGNYTLHSIAAHGVFYDQALAYFRAALTIYRNEKALAKVLKP